MFYLNSVNTDRNSNHSGGSIPLIASGGIMDADDAIARIEAGASLVQVYSGLIYRGPRIVKEIAGRLT